MYSLFVSNDGVTKILPEGDPHHYKLSDPESGYTNIFTGSKEECILEKEIYDRSISMMEDLDDFISNLEQYEP